MKVLKLSNHQRELIEMDVFDEDSCMALCEVTREDIAQAEENMDDSGVYTDICENYTVISVYEFDGDRTHFIKYD